MDAVTLKGRKTGFELQLADWADWEVVLEQLDALLQRLAADTPDEGPVQFELTSGNRLLSADQKTQLERVFARFARFEITTIQAAVVTLATLHQQLLSQTVHIVGGIVRSGQVLEYQGAVLFVGTLHAGATLKTTGSIFVQGPVAGLLIAGANGDTEAVIAGDIHSAGQIRIADTYEIIEQNDYSARTLSYVNDLHILEHGDVAALKQMRPKLFLENGGGGIGHIISDHIG